MAVSGVVHRAYVTATRADNWVQVRCPTVVGVGTAWARPTTLNITAPVVGTQVFIAFENGDITKPVYFAGGGGGTAGPQGPAGTAGTVWYTGTGVPSSGLGVVNDLYINTDNAAYYKKTGASTWTYQGTFQGPAGANGTNGTSGVTDHGALTGLSDADHPISAIQDLQTELDSKSDTGHTHTDPAYLLKGIVINPGDSVPTDLPVGALVFTRDAVAFGYGSKVASVGTSNVTTFNITLTGAVAAGQWIIATIVMDGSGGTAATLSGTVTGNSWATAAKTINGSTVQAQILYVKAATALAIGDTVSITAEASWTRWAVILHTLDGLAASPLDKTATATGSGTSVSIGATATTAQNDEIAVAVFGANPANSGTLTVGSGWTDSGQQDSGSTARRAASEYKVLTATGTVTATGTLATAALWAGVVATFKKA